MPTRARAALLLACAAHGARAAWPRTAQELQVEEYLRAHQAAAANTMQPMGQPMGSPMGQMMGQPMAHASNSAGAMHSAAGVPANTPMAQWAVAQQWPNSALNAWGAQLTPSAPQTNWGSWPAAAPGARSAPPCAWPACAHPPRP